ncbi:uncharacterized protein B0T15DRAFT_129293 [Chaetomium strumarium]|uniref:GPI anchored protein n=1 Tax=Chaetomium strumarium TaxID=1170767 RepID=A0AAJ0GZM2_9PEZI|nr:hypothetical protein B0T15DRAFT_129293 [Chaetomium strumarium]
MRPLPSSLWLLIAAQIEARVQAQAESHSPLQQHRLVPTAIRKMPPDQGAKFHHEYCAFPEHEQHAAFAPASSSHKPAAAIAARSALDSEDALRLAGNASAELPLRPPFAVLSGLEEFEFEDEDEDRRIAPPPPPAAWDCLFRRAASALAFLEKRQWSCPSGTSSCASIGYPNSCCGQGETCVEVPDTGLGPVGCCLEGAACGGGISGCPGGSTTCGSEVGGGCCIPGFVCAGVGCVRSSSSSPSSPSRTQQPSLTTLTTTSTSIIPLPTPSTVLVTVTVTLTPSSASITSAITSTITQTVSPSPSSGSGPGAPFRPTSSSSSATQTNTNTFCPTGFYPCLATAGAGCCQTGRDCAVSSCPLPGGMTAVQSNGVTVLVPAGSTGTGIGSGNDGSGSGSCASGWFLCDSSHEEEGGEGCCPSGYSCGTASCFATATTTQSGVTGPAASVAKALPGANAGANGRLIKGGGCGGWWWLAGMAVGWVGWGGMRI